MTSVQKQIEKALAELKGGWRFRWHALAVAWIVCVLGWVAAFLVPDTFEATARVYVDTNTALSKVTRDISVDADVDSQINRVRQALLGAPQLQAVAEQADLLLGTATPRERQAVVENLRREIKITGALSASSGMYMISYQNRDRANAVSVVSRLLDTFVENSLGGKREGSATAQQFLVEQIAQYEARLAEAEERRAEFKKRNVGMMPGSQGDYFTRLQDEEELVRKAQAALSIAVRRRDDLRRQLTGEQPFATPSLATSPSVGAPLPGGSDTATRIREAQARLDEAMLKYTDRHPEVLALRQTLDDLRSRQAQELEAARNGDAGAADRIGLSANPVYQSLQLQYNQAQVEVGAAQTELGDRQRRVAELRLSVNTAPGVEAEFTRLNRDYEVTRSQYQALVERLERTRVGEEAAQTGIVRFEIIDPPMAAFEPVAPKRPLLVVLAFLVALAAGAAVAFVLHVLRPVFGTSRQLNAITQLPVLGTVSMAWQDRLQNDRRQGTLYYAAGAAGLACALVIVLVIQPYITQFVRDVST